MPPVPKSAEDKAEAPKPPEGYTQTDAATDNTVAAIDDLLNVADDLKAEKSAVLERIGANRDMLRGYLKQQMATPEQAGEIVALYPERDRKTKENGDDNAAAPADDKK